MIVKWTEEARRDLAGIEWFIEQENPAAAEDVARFIFQKSLALEAFPLRGRAGKVPETRELVLTRYPYTIVYRILAGAVEILSIVHQSKNWPPVRG